MTETIAASRHRGLAVPAKLRSGPAPSREHEAVRAVLSVRPLSARLLGCLAVDYNGGVGVSGRRSSQRQLPEPRNQLPRATTLVFLLLVLLTNGVQAVVVELLEEPLALGAVVLSTAPLTIGLMLALIILSATSPPLLRDRTVQKLLVFAFAGVLVATPFALDVVGFKMVVDPTMVIRDAHGDPIRVVFAMLGAYAEFYGLAKFVSALLTAALLASLWRRLIRHYRAREGPTPLSFRIEPRRPDRGAGDADA